MGRKPRGITHHSEGYLIVSGGRHGTYQHRQEIEKVIGRKLTHNEIVHHINGDKTDNSLSNLQLMTFKEHMQLHLGKQIQVECAFCHRKFSRAPSELQGILHFCSIPCSAKYYHGGGIKGKPFDEAEDKVIIENYRAGAKYNQIAKLLNRNRESIRVRVKRLEKGGKL